MMMPLRTLQKVLAHFKGDRLKAEAWLNTPNKRIDNMRPKDLIIRERGRRLDAYMDEALAGIKNNG